MFTGIIEAIGRVKEVENKTDSARISVFAELPQNDLNVGDSVAVNGVCLTVVSRLGNRFWADVSPETFKVTNPAGFKVDDYVNVERPMQMGGRLGGHLVQGHVDGVGKIIEIQRITGGLEVTLEASADLTKYIVKKGSVAINGVSLTIADCNGSNFRVSLIPHTVEATAFKYAKSGDCVNLEVDMIGKYVEKLTHLASNDYHEPSRITEEFLRRHGF